MMKRLVAIWMVFGIAVYGMPVSVLGFTPPNEDVPVETAVSDGSPQAVPDDMLAQAAAVNQDPLAVQALREVQSAQAGGVTVQIPHPPDVNGDGYITPIDSLIVINDLNARGARLLGEDDNRAVDDNVDHSPVDPEPTTVESPGPIYNPYSPVDPLTPPSDSLTPPSDPVTPPVQPVMPPADPGPDPTAALSAAFGSMNFEFVSLSDYADMITTGMMHADEVLAMAIHDELMAFHEYHGLAHSDYLLQAGAVVRGEKDLDQAKEDSVTEEADLLVEMEYMTWSGSWIYIPGLDLDHGILPGWSAFVANVLGGTPFYAALFAAEADPPANLFAPFDPADADARLTELLDAYVNAVWKRWIERNVARTLVQKRMRPKLVGILKSLPIDGLITPSGANGQLILTFDVVVKGIRIKDVSLRIDKIDTKQVEMEISLHIGPIVLACRPTITGELTLKVVLASIVSSIRQTLAELLALILRINIDAIYDILELFGIGGQEPGNVPPGDNGAAAQPDPASSDPSGLGQMSGF